VGAAYLCGEVGCLAEGAAFVAAVLILVLIGWVYVTWQHWAVRYLEELEEDIRRERYQKVVEQREGTHNSDDEEAA
jgi:hypothetical protein